MDVEIQEIGKPLSKLVLTSGLGLYIKSLFGVGAYYSVNNVTISEGRSFVEHTMPGRKGSVFQDMGRPAIKVTIEGNISEDGIYYGLSGKGGKNKIMLEELHKLCDAGKPVDFLCDMPALFGVSRVIIQELEATEIKGKKHNYNYKLTLKEWSESKSTFDVRKMYVDSLKKDAGKELLKKSLVVVAVGAVGGTYLGVTMSKTESLSVKVTLSKSILTAEETADVKATVSDSKGNPIADADVSIKQGDKELFSGKTNAEGVAVATFQSPDAGNYPIKATAKKDKYTDGEASASITVDTQIKARLTTDRATIKTSEKATIKLVAKDCNGKAINGVDITLACSLTTGTVNPASGKTDENGALTVEFNATAAGTYEVTATAKKSPYSEGTAKVTVKVIA
jgi:hypothetical protein